MSYAITIDSFQIMETLYRSALRLLPSTPDSASLKGVSDSILARCSEIANTLFRTLSDPRLYSRAYFFQVSLDTDNDLIVSLFTLPKTYEYDIQLMALIDSRSTPSPSIPSPSPSPSPSHKTITDTSPQQSSPTDYCIHRTTSINLTTDLINRLIGAGNLFSQYLVYTLYQIRRALPEGEDLVLSTARIGYISISFSSEYRDDERFLEGFVGNYIIDVKPPMISYCFEPPTAAAAASPVPY